MTIKLRPRGKSRAYPRPLPVLDGFFQSSSMVNTCLLRKTKIYMHVSSPRASLPVHKDWLTAWKVLFISQIYKPLAQTTELGFSSLQHLKCVTYLEMFSWLFVSCLPCEWNEGESVFLQKCWELEEIVWVQEGKISLLEGGVTAMNATRWRYWPLWLSRAMLKGADSCSLNLISVLF